MKVVSALLLVLLTATPALAFDVTLGAPWDGKTVPKGQQCSHHGGKGATPPMSLTNIPVGTVWVYAEFNDRDYSPLSTKGGHGTIGWPVKGTKATLAPMPEGAAEGPGGAKTIKNTRGNLGNGKGYLPPCSGGRGNRYFADLMAVDASGKVLEKARVEIGRY